MIAASIKVYPTDPRVVVSFVAAVSSPTGRLGYVIAPIPRPTVLAIQKAVAAYYALSQSELISERRSIAVARPRQVAMWLCKKLTTRSLPDIGRRFGGRDHTTVLHAVRRIEALRHEDAKLSRACEVLLADFGGRAA